MDNTDTIQYPDLLPERVFTPAKDGIQAYFTKFSPLSNFYPFCFFASKLKIKTFQHQSTTLLTRRPFILVTARQQR